MFIGIDTSRAVRSQRTGTERYSLEIIRHLLQLPEAAHHRWRLYLDHIDPVAPTTLFPLQTPGAQTQNVEFCHLPARPLWTHRVLGQEVLQRPPDLLFIPAHVLPLQLSARRLPPSVVTIHDLGYHAFPETHTAAQRLYLTWSTRWSAMAATRLIAVSQATARDLTSYYDTPPPKIDIVYEALFPEPVQPTKATIVQERYELPERYALFVGTIQPRKNLERVLRAYHKLQQTATPSWELVLAGGRGWRSELLYQLAIELGIHNQVHFLGYVADEALPALYRSARFFCFPSLFEGFGLPVLEAQHYGTPVMIANNSSLPEIAGDAALLVDPTDVDAIADAMLRLSQDEVLRQRLIAAGHENVKRFSWEKAAKETLAVLLKAAKRQ